MRTAGSTSLPSSWSGYCSTSRILLPLARWAGYPETDDLTTLYSVTPWISRHSGSSFFRGPFQVADECQDQKCAAPLNGEE